MITDRRQGYLVVTEDESRALFVPNDFRGLKPLTSLDLYGGEVTLNEPWTKPGIYDLKSFRLLYPLENVGFTDHFEWSPDLEFVGVLRMPEDVTVDDHWRFSDLPSLKIFWKGKSVATISSDRIFRGFRDSSFPPVFGKIPLFEKLEIDHSGQIDIRTAFRGPEILGFRRWYRERYTIDGRTGEFAEVRITNRLIPAGLIVLLLVGLAGWASIRKWRERSKRVQRSVAAGAPGSAGGAGRSGAC